MIKCLQFLKKCGIIHCDLKPENVLFKGDVGKGVKIIDFGSATFMDDVDYDYLQTRPYRAPEVTLGCHFDFAIDMWSVGCILYELENMAKALAINKMSNFDVLSDANKKKKYMLNNNLLFISNDAGRGSVEDLEVVVPKNDFDLVLELKRNFCDLSLIDFIQRCLVIDPGMRLSVDSAFEHEFLKRSLN